MPTTASARPADDPSRTHRTPFPAAPKSGRRSDSAPASPQPAPSSPERHGTRRWGLSCRQAQGSFPRSRRRRSRRPRPHPAAARRPCRAQQAARAGRPRRPRHCGRGAATRPRRTGRERDRAPSVVGLPAGTCRHCAESRTERRTDRGRYPQMGLRVVQGRRRRWRRPRPRT